MLNLMTSRTLQTAALGLVAVLLLLGFFFLYLRNSGGAPLELTDTLPDAANRPATGDSSAAMGAAPALQPEAAPPSLRVYVAGAVREPDVYTLQAGDRLVDAVQAAGGGTAAADLESVNLALRVQDGGYYFIPARVAAPETPAAAIARITADPLSGELPRAAGQGAEPGTLDELIDLNTATERQLERLPGIGPARAQAVIAYREQHGPFTAVAEITAVSGIGPGVFDNLRSLVTVRTAP